MDLKSLLKLLVETESPSNDKVAVDSIGTIIAKEARKFGAQVDIIQNVETGNHILARLPSSIGRGQGEGILLLCHMDMSLPQFSGHN